MSKAGLGDEAKHPRLWPLVALPLIAVLSPAFTFADDLQQVESAEPRKIRFSGCTWEVKSSAARVGPGPNYFSASSRNVWVDGKGRLHLKITRDNGRWESAEVASARSFGYGRYAFTLASPVNAAALDANAVFGLFTWSDYPAYHNREIDIEFSRWGIAELTESGSHTVQPWETAGNQRTFSQPSVTSSTHSFIWRPTSVAFRNSSLPSENWTYSGPDVPLSGGDHARMNLWFFQGNPPRNGNSVEIIVERFRFTPLTG
jgi:hypothetical protein